MSTTSASRPFIRRYNADVDLKAVIHIFRETCDESLKVEPLETIGYLIWCRPYLVLAPSTSFVLDDGQGTAVGYILGTSDTMDFCDKWTTQYLPSILPNLQELPALDANVAESKDRLILRCDDLLKLIRNDPHKLILGDLATQLNPWPGHFHIDILPSHQRQGYGKQLIDAFRSSAKAEGCTGAYLGMVASNEGAARFYEACGFYRLPHALDDGESGELGRTSKREDGSQTIYFVTDL